MFSAAKYVAGACLSLAAVSSAGALTFAEREFVCPVGGERFKTKVVASETRFGVRLDLRPVGALAAPHPLPVCPNGFVMFRERFSADEIATLTQVLLSAEYQDARKTHTSYYLAAMLLEKIGADSYMLGQYYLRAAWQAEAGPPDRLQRYRELALAKFDAHLGSAKTHDTRWWTAAILSAELERQLGRFDAAVKRIDALPLAELKDDDKDAEIRKSVLAQIRKLAEERKAQPERYVAR